MEDKIREAEEEAKEEEASRAEQGKRSSGGKEATYTDTDTDTLLGATLERR